MRRELSIRTFVILFLASILVSLPSQLCADPVWTVFRDTIGGSLAGLLVGLAIDVAAEGNGADATRVCFIAGTFAGLGLGIYQAVQESKPQKQSLLSIEPGKAVSLRLVLPEVAYAKRVDAVGKECPEPAYKLRLVGVRF